MLFSHNVIIKNSDLALKLTYFLFLLGPIFALVSPWTKDTVATMKSIPHVYPCKLVYLSIIWYQYHTTSHFQFVCMLLGKSTAHYLGCVVYLFFYKIWHWIFILIFYSIEIWEHDNFCTLFFFSKDPQLEDQDLSDVDSHGDNIFKVKYLFWQPTCSEQRCVNFLLVQSWFCMFDNFLRVR